MKFSYLKKKKNDGSLVLSKEQKVPKALYYLTAFKKFKTKPNKTKWVFLMINKTKGKKLSFVFNPDNL